MGEAVERDETRSAAVASMVETMARMQDSHNAKVHPQWRDQGYENYRAVWVECAELLDHFGWKWWKKQDADLDQVKLEVVDIWHFGLSDMIRAGSLDQAAPALLAADDAEAAPDAADFRAAVEWLAQEALSCRAFVMAPFVRVLQTLPLSVDELFRLYVGKNVLNDFRQAHGYKSGEYQKLWHGREDNEHLIEALEGLTCAVEQVPELLFLALEERYP